MNSGGSLKAGLNGGALLTPCDPLGARWIEGVRESYILFPVVVVVVVIVVVFKYIFPVPSISDTLKSSC